MTNNTSIFPSPRQLSQEVFSSLSGLQAETKRPYAEIRPAATALFEHICQGARLAIGVLPCLVSILAAAQAFSKGPTTTR